MIAACIAAAALFSVTVSSAQPVPSAPIEAFAQLPNKAPALSPDGKYFAMISEQAGRPVVAITEVGSAAPPLVITSPELLIDSIVWIKNDVLLIYSRINKTLGMWDKKSAVRTLGNATALLVNERKQIRMSAYVNLVDVNLDDPDVIFVQYENALFRTNVRTGKYVDQFMEGKRAEKTQTLQWYLDGHGKPVARMNTRLLPPYNLPRWVHTLEVREKDDWREIGEYNTTADTSDGFAGLSEDGKALIRRRPDQKSTASITRVSLTDGAETVLFNDPLYDSYSFLQDEWTGRIVGYGLVRDLREDHYFDPKLDALQNGLAQSFPGKSVNIVSADTTFNTVIFEVQGPRTPSSYYLLNRTTHQAAAIAASYPELTENMLGTVKPYPYKARDGLDIHAYLTLPPGREAKNLPLVVMPHGGPDHRDDMNFDWMVQFLANRGYAVLQPNFRGSSGYGRSFTEAGLRQWGLKMQDDISDGVKKTIADGIADPKRVCIFGASYGGYAALAGAAFTPELYACIVSFAGVSHLPYMLGFEKNQFDQSITDGSFMVTRIGDGFADQDKLEATSPALHADQVTAPVLLMHSKLDNTVPVHQSKLMAEALRKAGKKVTYIQMEDDDHYLTVQRTRLRLLQEVERFLKENIGN